MYNYNLINPINITYRNPKQNPYTNKKEDEGSNGSAQKPVTLDENRGGQRQFPNGNKVQVDYTKNKVNIAQVVEDFKSTIAAINAPKEISDEVYLYLNLVEAESKKDNPSREIILSNLKNASKISDKFIEDSLKKPSTVVEDWVNALFLQQVELKSNPEFVNEAFRVQIPENKRAKAQTFEQETVIETDNSGNKDEIARITDSIRQPDSTKTLDRISRADDFQTAALNIYDIPQNKITINEIKPIGQAQVFTAAEIPDAAEILPEIQTESGVSYAAQTENYAVPDNFSGAEINAAPDSIEDLTYSTTAPLEDSSLRGAVSFVDEVPIKSTKTDFDGIYQLSSAELIARNNFVRAKRIIKEKGDPYNALKLYDEALKLVQDSDNDNLKAAIHFERGKVFDSYDYAEYALKDYNCATKCSDNNLKTHAHIGMGRIYDDYTMFDPAVEHYSLAVETSEEAKNPAGKTKALRYLAGLFADRFDKDNMETFNKLSVDAAYETGKPGIVAKTLMEAAENFEYVGEDVKALNAYKEAAKVLFEIQDYSALSANYEAASDIMERLGNEAKAMSLLSKALLYRQKAELQTA